MKKESSANSAVASLKAGLAAGAPIVAGVAPFGVIYGAAANGLGLSLAQTAGMSLLVFAGSAQLVYLDLWGQGASFLVLVITGLVINLRLAMYSASLTPKLEPLKGPRALIAAYALTDESYGVSMGRFLSQRGQPPSPFFFFVGAGLPTWLSWQLSGLAGYLVGALIPAHWPLDLAVPLVFLALLVPMVSRGPKLTAAAASMVTAVAAAPLPLNLGLLTAVAAGLIAGLIHARLRPPAAGEGGSG